MIQNKTSASPESLARSKVGLQTHFPTCGRSSGDTRAKGDPLIAVRKAIFLWALPLRRSFASLGSWRSWCELNPSLPLSVASSLRHSIRHSTSVHDNSRSVQALPLFSTLFHAILSPSPPRRAAAVAAVPPKRKNSRRRIPESLAIPPFPTWFGRSDPLSLRSPAGGCTAKQKKNSRVHSWFPTPAPVYILPRKYLISLISPNSHSLL